MRALILLAESYPDRLDLQRILEFDYIMVHTGDVDGPPSIHPALPCAQENCSCAGNSSSAA